jgi:hypothetical protein
MSGAQGINKKDQIIQFINDSSPTKKYKWQKK